MIVNNKVRHTHNKKHHIPKTVTVKKKVSGMGFLYGFKYRTFSLDFGITPRLGLKKKSGVSFLFRTPLMHG